MGMLWYHMGLEFRRIRTAAVCGGAVIFVLQVMAGIKGWKRETLRIAGKEEVFSVGFTEFKGMFSLFWELLFLSGIVMGFCCILYGAFRERKQGERDLVKTLPVPRRLLFTAKAAINIIVCLYFYAIGLLAVLCCYLVYLAKYNGYERNADGLYYALHYPENRFLSTLLSVNPAGLASLLLFLATAAILLTLVLSGRSKKCMTFAMCGTIWLGLWIISVLISQSVLWNWIRLLSLVPVFAGSAVLGGRDYEEPR